MLGTPRLSHALIVAVLLLAYLRLGWGAEWAQPSMAHSLQGETVFKSEVELVVLNAAVYGQNRQLVTGLPREAFQLFQDGKPQPIHQFSSRDIPVSLGILVDSSASMTDKRSAVNAAALALVRASNPEDEVFIVNFKDTPELAQDYTHDIAALEQGTRVCIEFFV